MTKIDERTRWLRSLKAGDQVRISMRYKDSVVEIDDHGIVDAILDYGVIAVRSSNPKHTIPINFNPHDGMYLIPTSQWVSFVLTPVGEPVPPNTYFVA